MFISGFESRRIWRHIEQSTYKHLSTIKAKFSYAYPQEFPYRINHILECEFYLMEIMDCCL
ncbi:hypothetical protein BLA29_014700, partial [Euroglyphus maynei]